MTEKQLAFPAIGTIAGKPNALNQPQMMSIYQSGMTLRDYFAAQALQGMLASGRVKTSPISHFDDGQHHDADLSHSAYVYADAMLAAREAQPDGK